ncbi:MAG: diguanylate cyclase response regulator, partial [Pseudomonadota bacterium]
PGERTDSILAFFHARGLEYRHFQKMPAIESAFWELAGDLILVDSELSGIDIIHFLSQCRTEYNSIPVVAFHSGAHGTRDAALIRMGAFDAMSKNIDQWTTEVYLERAIHQAVQAKRLLSLSRTDHLTGLYNQGYLYENLEREIRRANRTSKDLTVALLDLDSFKSINETYGNLKGDDILAGIAGIIKASIRKGVDTAYRYGGDEYMLVLPETGLEQATLTIERLLEKLVWRIQEKHTFSIGLVLAGDCEDPHVLLRATEEAVERAQNSGGNTIIKAVCKGRWLEGSRVI